MSSREIPNLHVLSDTLISEGVKWTAKINALSLEVDKLRETKQDSVAETNTKRRVSKALKEAKTSEKAVSLITQSMEDILHNNPIRSRTRSRSKFLSSLSPQSPGQKRPITGRAARGGRRKTKKRRGKKC